MTTMTLCALVLPMCRMAADPAVRDALAALDGLSGADCTAETMAPLLQVMQRHPREAAEVLALLGAGADDGTACCGLDLEAAAFFHLCGQCSPQELLGVLTRCVTPPSAGALALLIGQARRQEAMLRYGLQLLWRLCGDESLPDALALFPEEGRSGRNAQGIRAELLRQLKGGDADA